MIAHGSRKTRILLSGWYGYENAGDEAILQVFLDRTQEWASTRVLTGRPAKVTEQYASAAVQGIHHPEWRIHRGRMRAQLASLLNYFRTLRASDVVVVGGGGLLRDNTTWPNLLHLVDDIWIATLLRKKTALYAIGIGPFRTRIGRIIIRETVKRCDVITVRDNRSKQLLAQLGLEPQRITVVADPALLLKPQPIKDPVARRTLNSLSSEPNRVGLYVTNAPRVLELAPQLDALHARHGMSFVAIPLCCYPGIDDRVVAQHIRNRMRYPDALFVFDAPLSPAEVKFMTSAFPMNVTVRLHALIFSVAMGVPAVAVNYEPKVGNVARDLGLDRYVVEVDSSFPASLQPAVLHCHTHLDEYRMQIERTLPYHVGKAEETFAILKRLE